MRPEKLTLLSVVLAAVLAVPAYAKNGAIGNKEPIEINADTLEVFQEENRAVFTGHVVAIQGKTRLKSDKMTVYYRPSEEKAKQGTRNNSIKKIEVEGNVFLSTPEETASGLTGLYDVENNTVYLNDNVVLTRGNNTLKGDQLTYNLTTSKSVLTGGGVTQQGSKGKERVRALFVPNEKKQ